MNNTLLQGMATVSFWATDMLEAKKWYTELLGIEPYFQRPNAEQPFYIEFRLGHFQHELGIIDRKYAPKGADTGPGGAILYWQVEALAATFQKLLSMGAKVYEPVTARGDAGFVTASVIDPFGNILGIMYNPHFVEMLALTQKA